MTHSPRRVAQRVSLEEAVAQIQPGMTLCAAMAASEPTGLLGELDRQVSRLRDLTLWLCLPMKRYGFYTEPAHAGRVLVENWFYGAWDRQAHSLGAVTYVPNNLHQAGSGRLASEGAPEVFWGMATPPDARGYVSLSTSLIYEKQMVQRAGTVVLELNEHAPRTLGDTQVHLSEVDFVVERHAPLPQLPAVPSTEVEEAIGRIIADLVPDGATIQLGIGGIPNAIARFLSTKKDLGVHTEMLTDGMVDLFEAGVITGRHKKTWPGKMVGGFALGSQRLYDFIDGNAGVELQQGRVTNDPWEIGRNPKVVSINTALQVDLMGQVCSQSLGSRPYSGTGGQLDTHRGAQLSPGGQGIIALRSSARGGSLSTLVPQLLPGAAVTVPSQDIDTVVTEYGAARLRGRSTQQRAAALIGIAHPDHRSKLHDEALRLGFLPNRSLWAVPRQETH